MSTCQEEVFRLLTFPTIKAIAVNELIYGNQIPRRGLSIEKFYNEISRSTMADSSLRQWSS